MAYVLKRLALTAAGWSLEAVDAVARLFHVQPLSDWANERWAVVARSLDGVLNGRS